MLALHVDFGWVFGTVTDSVLSLIWRILSLNRHSLSLVWRTLGQCGLVVHVLCLHRYLLLKLAFSIVIFSFLSDVLSSRIWLEAASFPDSSFEWHGSRPYWSAIRCQGSVHGAEVQVWLVTVAWVGSLEDWCARYSDVSRYVTYCR